MNSLESSNPRMKKSGRDRKPNVFKINELCVFTSTMGDEDSKVVMKCYYIPEGGKNWKFSLKMENDKDSQGEIHTQFGNRVADRQIEQFVVAGRRGLDCKYNQEEDKYKNPNEKLIQWNEETIFLQEICVTSPPIHQRENATIVLLIREI